MNIGKRYYKIRRYSNTQEKEYKCVTIPEKYRDKFKVSNDIIEFLESGNTLLIIGSGFK